jgi:hypothetical protein
VQVLQQWSAVRLVLYEYCRGYKPTQQGAWRRVTKELNASEVCHILHLYILSQLIVSQSCDVERGFSLMKECLGLKRLKTTTMSLDCRLRIKSYMYGLTGGENSVTKDQLYWVGVDPEQGSSEPNCVQIYRSMHLPHSVPLMIETLHETLAVENDNTWRNTLAEEFESLGAEGVFVEAEEVEQVDPNDIHEEVDPMVLLLSEGLPDEVEVSTLEAMLVSGLPASCS